MKKIVINTCFGGFGLSYEAVMRYAEIKGIRLYCYHADFGTDALTLCDEKNRDDMLGRFYLGSPNFKSLKDLKFNDKDYQQALKLLDNIVTAPDYITKPFNPSHLNRDDPVLIQVVEELGPKADGQYARLNIVEIPDDVQWEISEYDGNESIEEVHRSWA